jgi:uncharacterized protein
MLKNDTKQIQSKLANYALLNTNETIEGIIPDRLHHYRRLIYNIIDDALESAYPITRNTLSDEQWKILITDFVKNNKCQHPQLFKMPFELISFVEKGNYVEKFNIPFLLDLLHFEWIEIEVHTMKDVPVKPFSQEGDYIKEHLIFNPYLKIISLNYPIHKLKDTDISTLKGQYFVLVYREENGTVQYTELNSFSYFIITEMMDKNTSLDEAIFLMLEGEKASVKKTVLFEASKFILFLKELGVIKGVGIYL